MIDDDYDGIFVTSDVNPDGTASYIVTVTAGPDVALSLAADAAMRYVAAVTRAGVCAQHDAAVMRQLGGRLGLDVKTAGATVLDLRQDRAPVQDEATAPLQFAPIISATDFRPYVHVSAGEVKLTQWTPEECFQHAGHVVQVLAGADLDSAYLRYLTNTVGIDEGRARSAVNDLGNYDTGMRTTTEALE